MRNPVFKTVKPHYKKRTLEITLQEGRKRQRYSLPLAVLPQPINAQNPFTKLEIDPDTGGMGIEYELADGSSGSFPSDFVLYYCDPAYDWSPINLLKQSLKAEVRSRKISIRVLADALNTSPSQVVRILEEEAASKQLRQLTQLARLVGYDIEIRLREHKAA